MQQNSWALPEREQQPLNVVNVINSSDIDVIF